MSAVDCVLAEPSRACYPVLSAILQRKQNSALEERGPRIPRPLFGEAELHTAFVI